jgi:hypothetical protein
MAIFHANASPETMAAALLEDYEELAQTLNHLARAFGDLSLRERQELDEELGGHMDKCMEVFVRHLDHLRHKAVEADPQRFA